MSTLATQRATRQRRTGLAAWFRQAAAPVTTVIAVMCVAVMLSNGFAENLQFDKTTVANGQWWRVVTGHLVHWNWDHLFWDALMFVSLGAICERRNWQRFVVGLVAAAISIPLILWALMPEVQTYRGLSGLDTALFTLLGASMLREKWCAGQWRWFGVIVALFIGLVVKIVFEMLVGSTIFVDSVEADFQPVPLAHVVGAIVGIVVAIWPAKGSVMSRRVQPPSWFPQ